jgi:hypothetical protein
MRSVGLAPPRRSWLASPALAALFAVLGVGTWLVDDLLVDPWKTR